MAARGLGLVSVNPPQVADCKTGRGDFDVIHDNTSAVQYSLADFGYPIRSLPPPAPRKVPYNVCPDNLPKIEAWVKKLYATSAFNTCSHHRLTLMFTSPQVELCNKSEFTVIHKNASIPGHLVEKVKQDLDKVCVASGLGECPP